MNAPGGRIILLVIASLLGACGGTYVPPPPPSDADARAYLNAVVDVARAGDPTALCALGGGNCERALREAGGTAAVPAGRPVVVGSVAIQPSRRADGGWDTGGRLLFVCVADAQVGSVETDMLVFRDDAGRLISIEPVYWSGVQIDLSRATNLGKAVRPSCGPVP
jgi:hypothetical protein